MQYARPRQVCDELCDQVSTAFVLPPPLQSSCLGGMKQASTKGDNCYIAIDTMNFKRGDRFYP